MSKRELWLCTHDGGDEHPVLVSTTAHGARLELRKGEKGRQEYWVVADCVAEDLFLLHYPGAAVGIWGELYVIKSFEADKSVLVAVEYDASDNWLFDQENGQVTYVNPQSPHNHVCLDPDDWGQLEAVKHDWSPSDWNARLRSQIPNELGVPELTEQTVEALVTNSRLAMLALREVEQMSRVGAAIEELVALLLSDEANPLHAVRYHHLGDTKTLGLQVVDRLHLVLHLLTGGQVYTGLLNPSKRPDQLALLAETAVQTHRLAQSVVGGQQ